jgi:hypothetical protein
MTDLNQLLTTFPDSILIPGPLPIELRSTDAHNQSNFITDEGFLAAFYRGDFTYCLRDWFHCDTQSRYTIPSISVYLPSFEIIRAVESNFRLDLLIKGSDWWASIGIMASNVSSEFGSDSLARVRELSSRFHEGLAARDVPDLTVSFQVWTGEDHPSTKSFDDVYWNTINDNYPACTRTSLEALSRFTRAKSTSDGRVILFHGPPGTGKTWAIRSLLTSWKIWAQAAIVLDPENLLSSPAYLMKILDQVLSGTTRLLVIEDADEVVKIDGTRSSGLSRLLNATDGMIGANSDIMVLLTTNASPGLLDPALLRPGRCLAMIGFDSFSSKEANERLGHRGPAERPMTLAEIYRQLGQTSMLSNERPVMSGQYL